MNLQEIIKEIEWLENYPKSLASHNGCVTEEYYNKYFIVLKQLHNQKYEETKGLFDRMTELYKRVRGKDDLF